MSRFTTILATSQALTLAAWEEASRMGQRTADIDHLFLALVIDKGVAGQILRGEGVTLERARQAVVDQHASQLAALGIAAENPTEDRIVFYETDGYEWGERPSKVIEQSSKGGNRGDSVAVLRALIAEPSGLIAAILQRLEVSPDDVLARLAEADRALGPEQRSRIDPRSLSGTAESFVPAPPAEVWALLANPERMPEWEVLTASVEFEDASGDADVDVPDSERSAAPGTVPGDAWIAHAATELPGNKRFKVKPEYARQRVELLEYEEETAIAWRFGYPDSPKANSRRIRIGLEPAAGGTQLRISYAWERKRSRKRFSALSPLSWLMRPLYRFAVHSQLSTLSGGIGRVFR